MRIVLFCLRTDQVETLLAFGQRLALHRALGRATATDAAARTKHHFYKVPGRVPGSHNVQQMLHIFKPINNGRS